MMDYMINDAYNHVLDSDARKFIELGAHTFENPGLT